MTRLSAVPRAHVDVQGRQPGFALFASFALFTSFASTISRLALATTIVLATAACNVGPDFVRPSADVPARFDQALPAAYPADAVGTQVWKSFKEPELDALIARALAANRDIAQALARLDETRALAGLSKYSLFPTVTAQADGERSDPSGEDPFIPSDQQRTDTYRAGFDLAWEIDLFGSLRREKEAIDRRVDADSAAFDAVRLSIVAETAQAYFAWRGSQARLAVQRRNLANLEENLDILRKQLEAGRGTELDVARSHALGLSVAAQLPQTEAEVVRQEQRLAVLTAQPVSALRAQLAPAKGLPALPALVPVGTPADWLARRPDIREAEGRLAEQVAQVGVATAEFYPKLELLGGFGATAQSFGNLSDGAAQRWRFGPSLTWSFLDFGRVRQRVLAQQARADGAIAAWHQAWLEALEETENALAGYRAANQSAQALELAVAESRKASELARLRFDAGASDYLAVLDAERSLLDFEDRAADAQTRRATALAALYKALAGDFAGLRAARPEG
ncbi:MAG: Solvent efflux pump outer membrane protein SrpC [Xanthomonadales bacterium]|nr:Solvent efflux pump outer membrane protein SrpC [Xanthomonadales bacterium]